ncbi:predicted protein [Phaeodactylum tricornutum CCAP 1055/1]|uniref:Uncharacterized protein n=1 Tax=Phaeodactylum tricornutum (strain CCAP 1055/1) TaxID=556484 RepID=B7FXD4_PHATC|nr:predicted protein [Phaeodactylum tricornutum CCAP 1055/1]EEC49141.1 predicted protein [Phaeodactylum tricornutum CCAP 1055/1]|eukprot:XP_002179318.1 predicted protein [Phaeodactylum tricornutum CCAP 1055/1]
MSRFARGLFTATTVAMANRAMCNVLYNRSYVQESYELDAMVEKMSPGFLAALENNNGIEVPRPDGSEYTVGSYEWCNSYASDELSDYDWDAACEKADISAELDVIVETVSPGFWGNYSLHHKEQVIRGSNTSNFRDDPYEWCSSEVADKLDDTEWNSKCDSLGRRRLQQAPIIHWHAIATSSASELMIAHHRVPRVNESVRRVKEIGRS